ncbi:hypothetical protein [Candidatus Manganitrophus noduliformans]|uniref:Uncharacterized protein n=1 Tax=Candidatus Manganitrophus noduliformans TaxID=2606439 RepID=A0A7X6DN20_9BACT|nr:hypothetical protein [Candidatus Manganitrophus noduliformans]NKE70184.1 hypothetical protein [Candidatus Manganitrophus noduliformans]
MADIDWDRLQKQIKDLHWGEKIGGDIDAKYASLVADFTREKFQEWQEKLGPVVRDIIASNKDDPEAAAEALILIILQIVHHLAQHEVLFEYSEKLNAKMIEKIRVLDERTAVLFRILAAKGVLSENDLNPESNDL